MATVSKLFRGKLTFETDADPSKPGSTAIVSDWSCQATQVVLEQDEGDTEDSIETLCGDQLGGGSTSGAFHLTGTMVQDFTDPRNSVQKFSWQNNGREVHVTFIPDDKRLGITEIVGDATMKFLGLGGEINQRITRDFDFVFQNRPKIRPWDPPDATGVTPGAPGSFTPIGSMIPDDLADIIERGAMGQTTRWDTGDYVVLANGDEAYWDGTKWTAGRVPAPPIAGVTAGSPGRFTPEGAQAPVDLTYLQTDAVVGDTGTSKPGPAWGTGEYVELGDASEAYWNGTAWKVGRAPTAVVPITAVTAGSPGTYTPGNATRPADLSALQGDTIVGDTGSNKPGAAWTTGQSIKLADNSDAHWDGDAWAEGTAP